MRKFAGAVGAIALVFGVCSDVAFGQAVTSARVAGTNVVVEYPTHWQPLEAPTDPEFTAYLEEFPEIAVMLGLDTPRRVDRYLWPGDVAFVGADLDRDGVGDGENVVVKVVNTRFQARSLSEWRLGVKPPAKWDAKVVSNARRRVGGHRAFTHIERLANGYVWAFMHIYLAERKIIEMEINLDPGGEEIAQTIMDSART